MGVKSIPVVSDRKSVGSFLNDPEFRSVAYQVVTFVVVALLVYWIAGNTIDNLRRANVASGYAFLKGRAGFDIGQSLLAYTSDSTYMRALLVGLTNTLVVAGFGIVVATVIGFIVGVGRLSDNWLIARLSLTYVEVFRNIPPLLVIFFWYSGVLAILPQPRESIELPLGIFLNNRGIAFPSPIFEPAAKFALYALVIGVVAAACYVRFARHERAKTGLQLPIFWTSMFLVVGLPAAVFGIADFPVSFDMPIASKFSLEGGGVIGPEFLSLFLALSFYHAAFIAELVRAGIRGVPKGQMEAAEALGVRHNLATRLVILPQALRIIIPPLTSQYLNLTKNSSLAIAVGYADLVAVGGTILNQTGQAVEVVSIWIVIYLSISLATSLFMNWFNARVSLVER